MAIVKLLNGLELSGFVKERQAHAVRALKQTHMINPKMVILRSGNSPVTDLYLRIKQNYGIDIGAVVEVENHDDNKIIERITELNNDQTVHGIIVQLPLNNPSITNEVLAAVKPEKDIDGLTENSVFDSATAIAINWLLAGYNVELLGKQIVIVGQGRLVGAPLYKVWLASGYNVQALDVNTKNNRQKIAEADVIVSATGVPGLITNDIVKKGAVIVDAGTAIDSGQIVGDVAEEVRIREDITITPIKGGVGPLTVSALFDNLIRAAQL